MCETQPAEASLPTIPGLRLEERTLIVRMPNLAALSCRALIVGFVAVAGAPGIFAQGGGPPPPPPPPPLPPVPVPQGNPITLSKVNLGHALFWDEQLSSTRTMSCGTCHIPGVGGSDPLSQDLGPISLHPGFDGVFATPDDVRGSPGVPQNAADGNYIKEATFGLGRQVTGRKAPTMINAAFAPNLFWDGRADTSFEDPVTGATLLPQNAALESQAAGPPLSTAEMGHIGRDWPDVAARMATSEPLALASNIPTAIDTWLAGRSYPQLFQEAFGSAQVTPARIIMAIATYERTLISEEAPIDLPPPGQGQPPPLTQQEAQGFQVFVGQGRCVLCHTGGLFSDNQFHNIGVRPIFEDQGRGAITGNPADNGRFKTPGLRNVGLRAPYFHNGSAQTLMDVVDFYDRGGDFQPNQDPLIIPLNLSPQQKGALVAFLNGALTDDRVENETGPFERPTLYSETSLVPEAYGAANPGSLGAVPRWVAVEPPVIGNPSLTLGVDRVVGGSTLAFLGLDVLRAPPGTFVNGIPFHLRGTPAALYLPVTILGLGAGEGWTTLSAPVPNNPALDGLSVDLQLFVRDLNAVGGFAATSGLELTFFES